MSDIEIICSTSFLLISMILVVLLSYIRKSYNKEIVLNEVMKNITRIEVIDHTTPMNQRARVYVKYLKSPEKAEISIQDEGRTMKIFISDNK